MTELFANIPEETKKGAELVFDAAISTNDLVKATRILTDYTNSITDTDVLEFVFLTSISLVSLPTRTT